MKCRDEADRTALRYNCSLDAAMSVIEGRWKCTILCMLSVHGPLRFSELQKRIGEISARILSKQLKELESDGMVTRSVDASGKVRVEYSITPKTESLLPVLRGLAEWGAVHQAVNVVVPADPLPEGIPAPADAATAV